MNLKNIIHIIFFINIFSCSHTAQKPIHLNLKKQITLAFVGDIILHERIRKREERTHEGFQVIWQDIQQYLTSANYTYANLEGPVAPEIGGIGVYPMFNYPEKIIPNLKDSGFDVVSTANNHALDRGVAGIKQTIKNLNKYKLKFTGTISSAKSDENFWTMTDNIAWLACTEMTNGVRDKENLVLYCFKDREKIKNIIKELSA
ncbi:MAG: CapA family protein, partial [Pseudobdellovibrio sp.]